MGRGRGSPPSFPSRERIIFALLVLLISPHYTIGEPGTEAIAQGKRKMDALGTRIVGALTFLTRACTTGHNK